MANAVEKIQREDLVERAVRMIMLAYGLDGEHFSKTPYRVWKAFEELFASTFTPPPTLTSFTHSKGGKLVLLRNISLVSTCSHHLMPYIGEADVAYLPDSRLLGLSKLARVVSYCAAKPTVQEDLTDEVATAIFDACDARGVAVRIVARHSCLSCRGALQREGEMVTHSFIGEFQKDAQRQSEFLHAL